MEHGITIGNKIPVSLMAFCCDAPVRSDLKNIYNHNSYYSSERCVQRGQYLGGHVNMQKRNNLPPCTDDNLKNRLYPEHHISPNLSVLELFGIGMVSKFSLDYMHCERLDVTCLKMQFNQAIHMQDLIHVRLILSCIV